MTGTNHRVSLISGAVLGLLLTQPGTAGWFDQLKSAAETAVEQTATAVLKQKMGNTSGNGEQPAQPTAAPARVPAPSAPRYSHAEVRAIQERLNALGYNVGKPDGLYGPGTRRGIESFQRDHGVTVTGAPSSQLLAQMRATPAPAPKASTQIAATPPVIPNKVAQKAVVTTPEVTGTPPAPSKTVAAAQSPATPPPQSKPEVPKPPAPAAAIGTAGVAQKVVGPLMQNADAYTVSETGSHLATLNMHGSRYVVTVDGVDGPRVNAVFNVNTTFSGLKRTVAMSDDGSHYAYAARVGHDVVIFADGKQLMSFPENSVGGPVYMIYSPHGGDHLFFSMPGKYQQDNALWVDGKQAMDYDTGTNIVFSQDGKHYLYIGLPKPGTTQHTLIVDGKDAGYPVDDIYQGANAKPTFTADGKHVIYAAGGGTGRTVYFDGKPQVTGDLTDQLFAAPMGSSYAAVIRAGLGSPNPTYRIYLNGKEVPGTAYDFNHGFAPSVVFSPDGRHLAVACNPNDGNAYVVRDGKKGETYDRIDNSITKPEYSADSQSLGYFGVAGNISFAVVDGKEYDAQFDSSFGMVFSPTGHHVAVIGHTMGGGTALYVDGQKVSGTGLISDQNFAFSHDGTHWLVDDLSKDRIMLDGKLLPFAHITGPQYRQFSPDGSKLWVRGTAPKQKYGLYVIDVASGKMLRIGPEKGLRFVDNPVFSPDGKHLYYEASGTKFARSHGAAFIPVSIFVDGQDTGARFEKDLFPKFQWAPDTAACTQVGTDDKLRDLRSVNGEITLLTVTPPAGGLASLL